MTQEQVQKQKQTGSSKQDETTTEAKDLKNEELDAQVEDTLSDIDEVLAIEDVLDEIDDILETNAEEFVNNYIQKGGQ